MNRIIDPARLLKKTLTIFGITAYFFACSSYSALFAQFSDHKSVISNHSARWTPTLAALEIAKKSVVNIQGDRIEQQNENDPNDIGKAFNGMGTGIVLDSRGYIVTNYHVIDGIRKIQVTTLDKTVYTATLVGRDPVTDIAMIKINGDQPFATMKLGSSNDVLWGEKIYAIGNPFGYPFSLTEGVVSGVERDVPVNSTLTYPNAIQICADINPGNSGGPLLNADGEMIGMNAAIRQGASGIAFAIPIDQVTEVAARLIQQKTSALAYHGLRLKTDEHSGNVVVESVEPKSPAEKAGFEPQDVVVSANDRDVRRTLDFYFSLLDLKSNETLQLSVSRRGEPLDLAMQLTGPKRGYNPNQALVSNQAPSGPPEKRVANAASRYGSAIEKPGNAAIWDFFGIQFVPVSQDTYRQQFPEYQEDYPDGAILVKAVRPGSPLAQAGIEKGDVIFGMHEWTATSEADLLLIIEALQQNKPSLKTIKVLLCGSRNGAPREHYQTTCRLP